MALYPDGERICALREQAGLSQAALAEKSGMDIKTLWRIENAVVRTCRPWTLKAIADVLGVEVQSITRAAASKSTRASAVRRRRGRAAHRNGAAPATQPTNPGSPLTPLRLAAIAAAPRAYKGSYINITGRVRAMAPLSDNEVMALGLRPGFGARFQVTLGLGSRGRQLAVYTRGADATVTLLRLLENKQLAVLETTVLVAESSAEFEPLKPETREWLRGRPREPEWDGFPFGPGDERAVFAFCAHYGCPVPLQAKR